MLLPRVQTLAFGTHGQNTKKRLASTNQPEVEGVEDDRVPITCLSGFLGAGKTTLLQQMLENREGLRIGMIVNDVASVNVDAKLVRDDPNLQSQGETATVELQNGCVCCSMSDELFTSVFQLVSQAYVKGYEFDHIVIECSGVAEPASVRTTFQDAESYGMPLLDQVRLDTMVTVVDAGEFLDAYTSSDRMLQRPDLGLNETDPAFETAMADGSAQRAVVDLLVEQVECADVVVINKVDRISEANLNLLGGIIRALNPRANILPCSFGKAPLTEILGVMAGEGIAESGVVDDHKETLAAAIQAQQETASPAAASGGHDHDHSQGHDHEHEVAGFDPDCKECQDGGKPAHEHSHGHDHGHEVAGFDPDCKECQDGGKPAAFDPDCVECQEGGHDHAHAHTHDHNSHGHSHDHSHAGSTTAAQRFGIDNFVYRQRRPFHPTRLADFLKEMPATVEGMALASAAEGGASPPPAAAAGGDSVGLREALQKLVRSKGFMWMASSDLAAFYWSHAGRHFEMQCLGRWWDSVPEESWPPGQDKAIKEDFEGDFGDRRQELVFIGLNVSDQATRRAIEQGLDKCLVTDQELSEYTANRKDVRSLETAFPNPIKFRLKK